MAGKGLPDAVPQPCSGSTQHPRPDPAATSRPESILQSSLDAALAGGDDKAIAGVDIILEAGAAAKASDIHLEPGPERMTVRFRVQGELRRAAAIPNAVAEDLLNRLKVLGRLATYRKRVPQDGRARVRCGKAEADLRLSFFPTVHGEKAVVRFLTSSEPLRSLAELGMSPAMLEKFQERLERQQGAILLTGPAGSGKTTTMYASLCGVRDRKAGACNIMTIEDPVEHILEGVNQCQVQPAAGMGFPQSLRSLLRQDPDVIMVGEIRDRETAEIAIQAGLTGHLVISTLHSGSCAGVFTRLLNLDIEPYMAASSLTAVCAQRLVRKVCPKCATGCEPDAKVLKRLPDPGLLARAKLPSGTGFLKGLGCPDCGMTGFFGRLGVFELLLVDDDLRDLILEKPSTRGITSALKAKGHQGLWDDGLDKARQGLTTLEELALRLS